MAKGGMLRTADVRQNDPRVGGSTGSTGGGSKGGVPAKPGGLVGQVQDAYSKPVDFSGAQGVDVLNAGGLSPLPQAQASLDGRFPLANPNSYGAERASLERSIFDRSMNLLQPTLDRQEARMQTDLVNRGLAPTTEAYRDQYQDFSDRRGRALNDLALGATAAGAQEHQRLADLTARNRGQVFGEGQASQGLDLANRQQQVAENAQSYQQQMALRQQQITEQLMRRQQPINDLSTLLAGVAPGGAPVFPQIPQYAIQSPDLMGLTGSNYGAQAGLRGAQAGARGSAKGGLAQGLGTLGGYALMAPSDRRLKEDIEPVGKLDNGLTVYGFRYKGGGYYHIGLMADEVEKVHPEAVYKNKLGYKLVDYEAAVK